MPKRSKRYKKGKELVEKSKVYSIEEALLLLQKFPRAKFDESVEVHFKLGIDSEKTQQQVRGSVDLPHGSGKKLRIAVFTDNPEKLKEAEEAKAQVFGGESLIEEIRNGKSLDFDTAIATPDIMPKLARIAKILGPRGLMPNPKSETVTDNIRGVIEKLNKGKVAFKNDKSGNVHLIIGKISFPTGDLKENYESAKKSLEGAKPEGVKGKFIRSISLSTTMSPSVKVA